MPNGKGLAILLKCSSIRDFSEIYSVIYLQWIEHYANDVDRHIQDLGILICSFQKAGSEMKQEDNK